MTSVTRISARVQMYLEWLARALVVAIIACPATAPRAATGPWASGGTVRARLLTAADAAGTNKQIPAGLQISLNDGWDT